MNFGKEYIDVVLVPAGLLIILVYHLFLLFKYLNKPLSTSLGYENDDKRIWVRKILQVGACISSLLSSKFCFRNVQN